MHSRLKKSERSELQKKSKLDVQKSRISWNPKEPKGVSRQVNFYRTKTCEKCQNSNETFWVIFKHCVLCKVAHWHFFPTSCTPTGIYRSKNYHWAWCSHVITLSFSNLKTGHKMYAYTLSIYSAVHLGIYMHWLPSV